MGWFYEEGKWLPKDSEKARNWYLLSATQKNADAQNNLARMYYEGRGIQQNYKEALRFFVFQQNRDM